MRAIRSSIAMAVPIEPGSTFAAGRPQLMFEGQYAMPLLSRTYDMSPDGRRFLMIAQDKRTDKASPLQLVVVQNWLGELKRLVPTN